MDKVEDNYYGDVWIYIFVIGLLVYIVPWLVGKRKSSKGVEGLEDMEGSVIGGRYRGQVSSDMGKKVKESMKKMKGHEKKKCQFNKTYLDMIGCGT